MKIENDVKKIMEELQKPFETHEIEWRVGSTNADKTMGLALAYITNRAVQNRLDNVFGCMGWRNEFKEWKGDSQLCGISVLWNGEWITKWDGSDDSKEEKLKGGLSDSMKRCAYQWGIGRYLYELDAVWVKIKPCGKSFKLAETPKLPDWALSESDKQSKKLTPKETQKETQTPTQNKTSNESTIIEKDKKIMKSLINKYLTNDQLTEITSFNGKNKANTDIDTYTDKQLRYIYGIAQKEKTKKESEGLPL